MKVVAIVGLFVALALIFLILFWAKSPPPGDDPKHWSRSDWR